jgi:2-methylisocitrate lyase-like PEP mutase family enzyme
MSTQTEKGSRFRALHQRDRAFIIPNPWDADTARLLARMGFEALATTSAGYLVPYKEINDMFEP